MEDDIKQQFNILDVSIDIACINICKDYSNIYKITPEEIAEAWLAYSITNNNIILNINTLTMMMDKYIANTVTTTTNNQATSLQYQDHDEYNEEDEMMSDYIKTPKPAKTENGHSTPGNNRTGKTGTPLSSLKPATYSSLKAKSVKFSTRSNAGETLTTFGNVSESLMWINTSGDSCNVNLVPNASGVTLPQKAMYGFELLQDRLNILDSNIKYLSRHISLKVGIENTVSVVNPFQDQVSVVGRIDCDSIGRLNSKSVILQGLWDVSSGKTVRVNLDSLQNYSLFPGQIVAMRGMNNRGSEVIAQEIFSDGSFENVSKISDTYSFGGILHMIIASGPYTTSDCLDYDPLNELIAFIIKHKPHVAVLIGPFVDANHDSVQDNTIAETYKSYFEKLVDKIMNAIEKSSSHTQIVMISSPKDVFHTGIYPSPPFTLRKSYPNILLAPDPCILDIEGVKIGLTSTDILMHLSREEISLPIQGPDKIGRLCNHLINQQSFYPLWPSNSEVSVDSGLWSEYAHMSIIPNILVLPSDLQYFVKDLNNCIAVNPGHLTKGIGGGTFSRLQIIPNSMSPDVICEIMRI